MGKKLAKATLLTLLSMLLITVPMLTACGGEAETRAEIKYGWLWDFTGRAAVGTTQTLQGMRDYLRMVEEEEGPLPVKLSIITYDGRSDASRITPGYVWLRGQGADLMTAAPHDVELLRSRFEADQIPFFSISNQISTLDSEWLTTLFGPPESQIEIIMKYIEGDWEHYPTKPKVAFVGLAGVPFYVAQLDMTRKWISDNPDKFEWLGSQMSPTATTTWASEILRVKDADYVVTGMSGPPCASFLSESRQRGHTGTFIGPMESFLAFWSLMKGSVSEANLDGVVTGHWTKWWNDDTALMKEIIHYAEKYRTQSQLRDIYLGTGQFNGWLIGMILVDALERAVAKVGAENVTGTVLHEALMETDLDIEGLPESAKIRPGSNCFVRTVFLMEYQAAEGDWVRITDPEVPPSLAG